MILTALEPILIVQTGSQYGRTIAVNQKLTIGRHPSNDVTLRDSWVSRQHATLEVTEDGVYIADHGSANGTFVNGKRVADRLLILNSDELRIGRFEFVYKDV